MIPRETTVYCRFAFALSLDARLKSLADFARAGGFRRNFGNDLSLYFCNAGDGAKYV